MNNPNKSNVLQDIYHVVGIILAILTIIGILSGFFFTIYHLLSTLSPNPVSTPTATDTSPSVPSPHGVVTPQEVQTWCSVVGPGTCDISRFEQLPTAAGGVDPNQVHMRTGAPVKITIPQGFSAYIWDCSQGKGFDVTGPSVQEQVCEMKVWRSS